MIDFMVDIARESGKIAMKYFGDSESRLKDDNSVVTQADIKVNEYIKRRIMDKFPEHGIVSEELDNHKVDSKHVWYVDPIDGTQNFARKLPSFTISIGLKDDHGMLGAAVYVPVTDEMFTAVRGNGAFLDSKPISVSATQDMEKSIITVGTGPDKVKDISKENFLKLYDDVARIRDEGCCSLELCYVASGRVEGSLRFMQKPWDYAAGKLIVQEAGGNVTDSKGEEIEKFVETDILAGNKSIHDEILRCTI